MNGKLRRTSRKYERSRDKPSFEPTNAFDTFFESIEHSSIFGELSFNPNTDAGRDIITQMWNHRHHLHVSEVGSLSNGH
ncbi:hypothetical protein [Leptospira mtsangambouensis]|uniref:hypothetical protein n=1 Tax=Leptospira mtsangambouensis TaxID=2484912 RepID=UPI001EEA668B|nr:hypothetical protein [Leptospira mtsangambouensis]MCG6140540.1 hypothetical protein [Leptospira mtsangambouensis]